MVERIGAESQRRGFDSFEAMGAFLRAELLGGAAEDAWVQG